MSLLAFFPFFAAISTVLIGAYLLIRQRMSGTDKSKTAEVTLLVAEGLTTFLKRSLTSIIQIVVYSVIIFALFSYLFRTHFSWDQMKAFTIGGGYIATCAILLLWITPQLMRQLLVRHQRAYAHQLIGHILTSASGMSFVVLGLGLMAFVAVVLLWQVESLIGFGLGMVFAGFFLRIGGGLYKTTSDVAASSLASTDASLPTFDRRNPITLLEIAGDLIGGVMGFSTDIVTSFFFSLIACVLFASSFLALGYVNTENALKLFVFPIIIATVSLVVALLTWGFARIRLRYRSQNILLESIYLAVILVGGLTYLIARYLHIELNTAAIWGSTMGFHPTLAYLTGLIGGALIGFTAEVLTSRRYKTSQRIAAHTEFGAAVTVINGFSSGLVSNGFYSFYMIGIAGLSFTFGGIYGIALAALGMLSTTPTLLSATLFTPIAANSLKIATLTDPDSSLETNARKADRLGQTTAPIGNGFASGAATLSTFALFFSLIMSTRADLGHLFLMDPMLLFGILIGLALSLVFCGMLFRGLGKTVVILMRETVRQFRDIPYLMADKARPDVVKASTVLAGASVAALTWPALIMGLIPLMVGYALGIKWLCGVVLGTLLAGFIQSYYWSNVGDTLHNVRHHIASGHYGGMQSPTYRNALTADSIGDGFKDLLSPSVNIIMKSVAMIAFLIILLIGV